ncbi:hypothetical protein ABMA28_010911 [Loxostege sticticalis]|uniref:CCHC-type domain-containing protein n=1 Tax=Loxostege sticticalis TaxID=481309 RepID=A0ABD0S8A8_LOXSC
MVEVADAVLKATGCSADAVRVGEIRQTYTGGATIVRVPVAVAKTLAKGRLLVGWVSAQVKVLARKPLKCYRCLEAGHVSLQCTCETDRSRLCYRCGQPGHLARACSATPHCPVCSERGKPADHKVGSQNCSPPTTRRKAKNAADKTPAAKPVPPVTKGSVEAMETIAP